jgi:hypothetical protein
MLQPDQIECPIILVAEIADVVVKFGGGDLPTSSSSSLDVYVARRSSTTPPSPPPLTDASALHIVPGPLQTEDGIHHVHEQSG